MSDWRSRLREERGEGRDPLRERETLRERSEAGDAQTVGALINDSVRKLVTAIVVAGGLIGLGAYASGDEVEAPKYQVSVVPDGRIVRVNTESGTVLVCQGERCGIVVQRGQDLEDEPPPPAAPPREEARPALPAPTQSQDNQAAAPAPAPAATPAPAAQR